MDFRRKQQRNYTLLRTDGSAEVYEAPKWTEAERKCARGKGDAGERELYCAKKEELFKRVFLPAG